MDAWFQSHRAVEGCRAATVGWLLFLRGAEASKVVMDAWLRLGRALAAYRAATDAWSRYLQAPAAYRARTDAWLQFGRAIVLPKDQTGVWLASLLANVRFRMPAVACVQSKPSPNIAFKPSCIATPSTWQEKLAMSPATRCNSA